MSRRDELVLGLGQVRDRIARSCSSAGRFPEEIELIVVTKLFPATDIDLLVELGVRAIGENRDQEISAKIGQVRHRAEVEVHFVGQLQTNKASSVAGYADCVHSLDRLKLVGALGRAAESAGRTIDALVQVRLDGTTARGGALPEEAPRLADSIAETPGLELRGVMAVAPLGADPAPAFARLREVSSAIQRSHPQATWVSAGMSGDLEQAIAHGATHLRVGSAILGSRPSLG